MFNLNFFQKNKKEELANKIILSLNENNKISIALDLDPSMENVGKSIGELLYSINAGNLEEPIANMLVDFSKSNPQYSTIIEEIIHYWVKNKNLNNNNPYISPTKVFSQ
jgi:hypothetical protein